MIKVQVTGLAGCGKSTVSRVITKALREAGFWVSLSDKDDMSEERFKKCLEALQQQQVEVECVQTKG